MQPIAALLPMGLADACPVAPSRKIKAKDRLAQWRRDVERRTGELIAVHPDKAAEIEAVRERELARGPGWSRCRREARFVDPDVPRLDRNAVARLIWVAEQIARGFWRTDKKAAKASGQRIRLTMSRTCLDVLKAVARLALKHGRAFPSLEGLAYLAGVSRRTAVRCVIELEGLGLLTVHRRAQRVATAYGARMVQATSVYELHSPRGLAAMAVAIFEIKDRSSECQRGPARKPQQPPSNEEGRVASAPPPPPSLIPLPLCTSGGRRIPWQALLRRR